MFSRQLLSLLLFGTLLCLILFKHNTVERKCDNLLNFGRWSSGYDPSDQKLLWQPFDSIVHVYDKSSISKCLSDRNLYFIGDSTIRQVFWAAAAKHDRSRAGQQSAETGKHENILYHHDNISLSFVWDPYLNSSQTKEILGNPMIPHPQDAIDPSSKLPTAGIIMSTGLWHARYSGDEFAREHRQALDVAARYTPKESLRYHGVPDAYLAMTPAIILPPPVLNHHWLNPERAVYLSPERLANITENLLIYQETFGIEIAWSARAMTMNNSASITSGGLHVTREVAAYQAEVILNRVCNNFLFAGSKKAASLACVRQAPWKVSAKACLELLSLLLMGCCLFRAYQKQSKFFSQRLQAVVVMLTTIPYCWLADRTILLEKGNKLVDVRLFCFFTAAVLTISLARLRFVARKAEYGLPQSKAQNLYGFSKTAFLPREISEEWKGWMQIVILFYHYFGMSKTLLVYQVVRVLVASYLFLTGYGHAAYFLNTKDFSLRRVVKILLRLNLLTCLLSVVMENNHELYYFPALATVWFLITYAVFWKPKGRQSPVRELWARVLAMFGFCYIVLGDERLVEHLFYAVRKVHGPDVSAREFVFRFQLDVLAPFAGMSIAIVENRTFTSKIVRACTRMTARMTGQIVKLMRFSISLLCTIGYVFIASTFNDKPSYNAWHWILSILPIAAYLNARKALWESSSYFAPILAWIGSISLELFVLQYHLWLAADTKGLLRLGLVDTPNLMLHTNMRGSWAYWVEAAVTTIVYIWISDYCSRATNILVQWFVSVEESDCAARRTLLSRLVIASSLLWFLNILSISGPRR